MAPAVSRKRTTPSSSAPRHEVEVVVQDGRDDAGGAVGRGGDDPAAGGVLLVDGHRVEGDPVHARSGSSRSPSARAAGGRARAARRRTLGRRAGCPRVRMPRCHALLHDAPDLQQAGADLGLGAPGLLVLQHQRGDRQAGLPGEAQQLVAGAEGVGSTVSSSLIRSGRRPRPRRRRSRRRPSSTSSRSTGSPAAS